MTEKGKSSQPIKTALTSTSTAGCNKVDDKGPSNNLKAVVCHSVHDWIPCTPPPLNTTTMEKGK